jgi:hypothetical protein
VGEDVSNGTVAITHNNANNTNAASSTKSVANNNSNNNNSNGMEVEGPTVIAQPVVQGMDLVAGLSVQHPGGAAQDVTPQTGQAPNPLKVDANETAQIILFQAQKLQHYKVCG